jgi:hypothetical protein
MLPKPSPASPSSLEEGQFCIESTECVTGKSCRSGIVSNGRTAATVCVSDRYCLDPIGKNIGLFNQILNVKYDITFDSYCMKK